MNQFEGGYVDTLRGSCREAMLVGEGPDASAYRAGARTCRADLHAEEQSKDKFGESPVPIAPATGPDWYRRLTEFRAIATVQWAERVKASGVEVHHATVTTSYDIVERIIGNRPKQVPDLRPVRTPSAYAEPEPGAKKPKRAKPADDNQGSLFG